MVKKQFIKAVKQLVFINKLTLGKDNKPG